MTDFSARLTATERAMDNPNRRPKDAATLLILDRSGKTTRVLMGKRHMGHAFMPGKFVFPGGRVDPADSRIPVASDYDDATRDQVMAKMRSPKSAARARALAVTAIRETYEEAGLFIGAKADRKPAGDDWAAFAERSLLPDLAPFRLVARAITPPRRPRRFDTRFFAISADRIVDHLPDNVGPSGELEEVQWVPLEDIADLDMPTVTTVVIDELRERLKTDPDLKQVVPISFYRWRGKGFIREVV
ncbi:NUDIX hydrolase [Amorphus orientalis]|uniref:8-oxo-dGTP pyrophosphatase MutT (NUDIX family) n=1 Tax=Amorphus orientalis TaxID=649198 RepID=A0AAE4AVW1_9HYPH|nr:NUDIX hydrolase [Amorphus orientalis]MDQ0317114.1 8-oxo-dGTP pyrophosphatase MutT (NUDIX family) [Amorphus orientalis]